MKRLELSYTGSPRSTALHRCFLLQTEGLWQPCVKSIGTIFPTASAHFVSLCHILVILEIFQTFSLLLYLLH